MLLHLCSSSHPVDQMVSVLDLLQEGVSIDIKDHWGMSPLGLALVSESLKEKDSSLKLDTENTLYVLMNYAEQNFDTVSWEKIFGHQKKCLNMQNRFGYTFLHYACKFDLQKFVEKLLNLGVEWRLKNHLGNQAIHTAVKYSHLDVVKTLLAHGVCCEDCNKFNMTPLDIALMRDRVEIVPHMLPMVISRSTYHPLCRAMKLNAVKCFKHLLQVVTLDSYFCKGHSIPVIIEALHNIGPSLPRKVAYMMTNGRYLDIILDYIENQGSKKTCKLLQDLTACKSLSNRFGYNLLHYTCHFGREKSTKILLDIGVPISLNHERNTPLHLSCMLGREKVVRLLLDRSVSPYGINSDSLCPLSCACLCDNLHILELLLQHGTDPNAVIQTDLFPKIGDRKMLPINTCVLYWCSPKAVALLLRYGAFINFPQHSLKKDAKSFADENVTDYELCQNVNRDTDKRNHAKLTTVCVLEDSDNNESESKLIANDYHETGEKDETICDERPHMLIMHFLTGHPEVLGFFHTRFGTPNSLKTLIETLQYFISAGAAWPKDGLAIFDRYLCQTKKYDLIRYLSESGYRFSIYLDLPQVLEGIQSIPYTLQCMTANIIRTHLKPNAWVGVKSLHLPIELKRYIVMNNPSAEV